MGATKIRVMGGTVGGIRIQIMGGTVGWTVDRIEIRIIDQRERGRVA